MTKLQERLLNYQYYRCLTNSEMAKLCGVGVNTIVNVRMGRRVKKSTQKKIEAVMDRRSPETNNKALKVAAIAMNVASIAMVVHLVLSAT